MRLAKSEEGLYFSEHTHTHTHTLTYKQLSLIISSPPWCSGSLLLYNKPAELLLIIMLIEFMGKEFEQGTAGMACPG
jgi:hypothetical protein